FFFQAEDGIRDRNVTGVQTCALPISRPLVATTNAPLAAVFLVVDIALRAAFYADPHHHIAVPPALSSADRDLLPHLGSCFEVVKIGRASCRERVEVQGGSGAVTELDV